MLHPHERTSRMRFHPCSSLRAIVVLLGTIAIGPMASGTVHAQQATAGYVSGQREVLSTIALPDGGTIQRLHLSLVVTADDPTSIWHLGSQDCLVTDTYAADGSFMSGRGACDLVSPEGDIVWLTFETPADGPTTWSQGGGTGKFSGVVHSGTTVNLAQWGDGKMVGRWEGVMTTE